MQIFANAEWGEVVVRREKKLQLMLTHVRKIVQSIPKDGNGIFVVRGRSVDLIKTAVTHLRI